MWFVRKERNTRIFGGFTNCISISEFIHDKVFELVVSFLDQNVHIVNMMFSFFE